MIKKICLIASVTMLLVGCNGNQNDIDLISEINLKDEKIIELELTVSELKHELDKKLDDIETMNEQIEAKNKQLLDIPLLEDEILSLNEKLSKENESIPPSFLAKLNRSSTFEITEGFYYWLQKFDDAQYLSRYHWVTGKYDNVFDTGYMSNHEYEEIIDFEVSKDDQYITLIAKGKENESIMIMNYDLEIIKLIEINEIEQKFGADFKVPKGMKLDFWYYSIENKWIRGVIGNEMEFIYEFAINLEDFSIITNISPNDVWLKELENYPNQKDR